MHSTSKNYKLSKSLFTGLCLTFFSLNAAAQMTSVGSETLSNTTTANDQKEAATAMDGSGNYVIVWASEDEDGWDNGVYFQRYLSDGTANGTPVKANNTTDYSQRKPDVAMADDGTFVICWQSQYEDTDGWGVWFALYDNTGTLITRNRVNDSSSDEQVDPKVAMNYDGDFVVGYSDDGQDGNGWGVSYQGFNSSGAAQFAELYINTTTTGYQATPDVAMDSAGAYVWVWQDESLDGDGHGIFMQRFDQNDNAVGSETQVNTTTAGNQQEAAIAMDYSGNSMVVWSSYAQDGDHYGIYGQLYNTSGVAVGGEIAINTTTADVQNNPQVNPTKDGWVVTWTSYNQDGDAAGVYAQALAADGTANGSEVLVNTTTANYQMLSNVAGNANLDNLVIAWQSGGHNLGASGQDGDDYGIYHQKFSVIDTEDPVANCQNITVYLDGTGNVTVAATDVDNGSTDNYGITSYSLNTSTFTCANVGANAVTLTVEDAAGNTDACSATITVADTTSPTASCQDITVYLDGTGNASITTGDVDNGSTDNCSVAGLSLDQNSFSCAEAGTNTVTLTVTDVNGNVGACASTVTVLDTIAPTAVCQDITVYLDGAGSATITGSDIDAGSTDNCSGTLTLAADVTSFTCADIGANSVTLTVTDSGGNISTCTSTVTVADTTSPTASCQDITVYLDGAGNGTITAADIDNGSTDNCTSVTLGVNVTSFTCADLGANTVTLTVTDGSGNTSTCTSTVTVADSTSPTASCQDLTVYLDGTGNATITAADIDNGSTDNCTSVTLGANITAFTCSDIGANTVTLTVTDGSGNTSTCTSTVTIADSTSPVASCQDLTVYLDGTGNATIAAGDVDNGSTDNCGVPTLSLDISSFDCTKTGPNTVILTATDASGNTSTCTSTITVADTTSPTASCQDITVYLDGTGNATITAADIDNGSADNCTSVTLGADITAFTCANAGANTVTLTVTDASGNSRTCTSTVTVADSTSPTASCQDMTVYLDGAGNATIIAADIDNGSTDNCSTVTLGADITAFTCADTGANTVTLTVTDASGNTSMCTSTVTVADSTSPTASCQDITVYLDGTGNATITAADVDNGSTDNCTTVTLGADVTSFTCADTGANTVTLTVTDASGNTSTCTSTVTVIDSTAPTASCQDLTVYLDGTGNAAITTGDVDNGSTDNCSIALLGLDVTSFTCANTGANTVTLTVTDASGNVSTCASTVTVIDSTAPTASCQDLTVYLDGAGNATIIAADIDNGSSDNCSTVTLGADVTSFTCANTGANTVTLTVTDASGNTSTCTSTVTVIDSTAPTASCQDITVYLDGTGNATITAADIDNGSTDNCSTVTLGADVTSFTCADTGVNTVTLTVTDASGNTSTCTSTVTVLDTISPTVVCQDLTVYLDGTGNVSIAAADVDNGSTDNCASSTLSIDVSAFTCADAGANTVNLTITDASGNTSTCASTVTVLDTISPTVLCQDITVYLDGTGNATINAGDIDNGSTDNCSPVLTAIDISAFTCAEVGANTVTLTVTDPSGNTSTCTSTVTVMDTISPTFASCPSDASVAANTAGCTATYTWTPPVESDNCSVTVVSSHNPGDVFAQGTTTVSYTATDASGNTAVCSFDVTVTTDLIISTTSTDVLCNGDSTGVGNAFGSGGAIPYDFVWSTGETGATESSLLAGTHTVTLTDGLGCVVSDIVTIGEPPALTLSATVVDEMFGADGSIDLTVGGGAPPPTFSWSNSEITEDITGLVGGTYTVVVTDANGCIDSLDVFVDSFVGIHDVEGEDGLGLVIFPNPTTDGNFSVQLNGQWVGEVRVELVDSRGRIIHTEMTSDKLVAFELEELQHGTYFIQARDEQNNVLTRRLVTVND